MKILNFGSLNYDYVYSVNHIVNPGETISSQKLEVFCGGKGLNQSVALARAGAEVYHAGMVGEDGVKLREVCRENKVNDTYIRTVSEKTGHAIIQVSSEGLNSIVLFGGANRVNEKSYVDEVLSNFTAGDMVLLQNEINLVDYIIEEAYKKQMVIALNPSPLDEAIFKCDLEKISLFLMNEIEGEQITGEKEPKRILTSISQLYPNAKTVLTLGSAGVVYKDSLKTCNHGIYKVPVVDTTAAGDTFTGYFLEAMLRAQPVEEALRLASVASALAVSKKGATSSIPYKEEVLTADLKAV